MFPRKARWTLDSERARLQPFAKRANYSLVPRRVDVRWFEVILPDGTNPVREYIGHMLKPGSTDTLTLKTYNGTGNVLNAVAFSGCRLVDHFVDFDYSSDEVVSHKMIFAFESSDFFDF